MSCSINQGRASVEVPQGFAAMSAQGVESVLMQRKSVGHSKTWDAWGARCEESGAVLFANALKQPALRGRLASLESVRDGEMAGTQRVAADFELLERTERTVCRQKACGFKYSYLRNGEGRVAEHLLARASGYYYMFIVASSNEAAPSAQAAFEELLASVKFGA